MSILFDLLENYFEIFFILAMNPEISYRNSSPGNTFKKVGSIINQ